jgi:hypothetical protein
MTRKRWIALLVAAILAVVGAVVAVQSASASRGPNRQHMTTVTFSAEDLQLVSHNNDVRMVDYPDGAHMVQWTYYWHNNSGNTWDATSYSIWNVPFSSGGHTDTLVNSCKFNYVSDNMCTGGSGDGGTRVDFGTDNLSDAQTFWVRVHVKYGSTTYCRQIYGNNSGGTAWGYCTN